MRVGVYVANHSPEAGGGFTIVNELLGALRGQEAPSAHEFVVLTTSDSWKDQPSGALEVVSLRDAILKLPTASRVEAKLQRGYARMLGRRHRPDGAPWPSPEVDEILSRHRIDVIWYLSVWDYCTLEVPFMTVIWDLQHRLQPFFPEVSDDGKWDYRERWLSTVLRRAAMVVTGTAVGQEEIERFYGVPPTRIRVIPHPTPTFIDRVQTDDVHPGVDGQYLFYPAQFWPHKNHANLLEALRLLRADGLNLSLALTGSDKGNLSHVRSLAKEMGMESAVHMLGFVSEAQLVSLYRHAAALTYVTFFGPENLPPLEAFAAGCPVIASDVAGAREQLGEAALLVDPRSPPQIAAAVKSICSDGALRSRLVAAGRQRALRSTPASFVRSVNQWLDGFETTRRCWPSGVYQAGKGSWP